MDTHRQPQGVGLIEIMISVTVLAIGLLGLLRAFPQGIAVEKSLEYATIGSQLAQAKLEEYAATPYDEIGTGLIENQVRVNTDSSSILYHFLRTTTVSLVDSNLSVSGTDIGLKKVTITIAWPSTFGGSNRSTSVTTLVSER